MSGVQYTYIIASKRRGALYIGTTEDLVGCIEAHKADRADRFTREYRIRDLVHYEAHANEANARACEVQWKTWHRNLKIALIEVYNPDWQDLYPGLVGERPRERETSVA